jgi:hypothetical protein
MDLEDRLFSSKANQYLNDNVVRKARLRHSEQLQQQI